MRVLRNREARATMKAEGITVSQDRTRRQTAQLRELRETGKSGYFVGGKLYVREQPNTSAERTYRYDGRNGQGHTTARHQETNRQSWYRGRVSDSHEGWCYRDYDGRMEGESVGLRERERLRREQRERERVNELRREEEWKEERKRERKKATEQVKMMTSASRSDSGDECGEGESEIGEGSVCESENLMAWGVTGEGERGGRSGVDRDTELEPLRSPKNQRDRAECNSEVPAVGIEKERGNGSGGVSEESKNERMNETHNIETCISPLPRADSNHVLTQVTAHTSKNQNKPKDQSKSSWDSQGSRFGTDRPTARAAADETTIDITPCSRHDTHTVTCNKQGQDSVSPVEGEREREDKGREGDEADAPNTRTPGSRQTTLDKTVRIHCSSTAFTDSEEGGRAGGEKGDKRGQCTTNKALRSHTSSTKAPSKTTSSTRTNPTAKGGKRKK